MSADFQCKIPFACLHHCVLYCTTATRYTSPSIQLKHSTFLFPHLGLFYFALTSTQNLRYKILELRFPPRYSLSYDLTPQQISQPQAQRSFTTLPPSACIFHVSNEVSHWRCKQSALLLGRKKSMRNLVHCFATAL